MAQCMQWQQCASAVWDVFLFYMTDCISIDAANTLVYRDCIVLSVSVTSHL